MSDVHTGSHENPVYSGFDYDEDQKKKADAKAEADHEAAAHKSDDNKTKDVHSITYMPQPEDRDEVTVGGIKFKAYEPTEVNEVQAASLAHLTNNSWFTTGDVDGDRKKKWEELRNARRDIAKRQYDHDKDRTDRDLAANPAALRPVDGMNHFDPDKPTWGAPVNVEATSAQMEHDRLTSEAMASDPEREHMTIPVPGKIVWYWPAYNPNLPPVLNEQPHAAIIAHVYNDRRVNLMVINRDGQPTAARDVTLLQGEDKAIRAAYCEWMPEDRKDDKKDEPSKPVDDTHKF